MTPDAHTIKEFFIDVGHGHQLYVQDWGNKKAKLPIISLHGGPGGGHHDGYKANFDPAKQRIVFFDQRGSGRSVPYGSLKHNTTADLVADIEKIADALKLKKFILNGASWGVALALAYALAHPKRVAAMVLSGIFTGSQNEVDWLDKGRFRTFYPDAWERYENSVPKAHRRNPSAYHFERLLGTNEDEVRLSGYAYESLEGSVMSLDDRFHPPDPETYDPASIRIEVHYMVNRCFMPDRQILDNAAKLTMPIWLVQGRYDMVCPPTTAYELSQKLPDCRLIWTIGGHRRGEHETHTIVRTILHQLAEK